METMLVAAWVSWLVALVMIRWQHAHAHFTRDEDRGVQKFHEWAAIRVGGVGVAAGLAALAGWLWWRSAPEVAGVFSRLVGAAVPVFLAGLGEDVTRRVAPRWRLVAAFVSAGLAWGWVNAAVVRVGWSWADGWLQVGWVSLLFTSLAVAAVTHAFNIVDGFNGLASLCAVLILGAVGYVAHQVGDWTVLTLALGGRGRFWVSGFGIGRGGSSFWGMAGPI